MKTYKICLSIAAQAKSIGSKLKNPVANKCPQIAEKWIG